MIVFDRIAAFYRADFRKGGSFNVPPGFGEVLHAYIQLPNATIRVHTDGRIEIETTEREEESRP